MNPGGYGGYNGAAGAYGGYGGGQPQQGGGGGYGGYAAPPGMAGGHHGGSAAPGYPAPNNGVSPETQRLFDLVDQDRSGKISHVELKAALINGNGQPFSDTACKLMIGMFDNDHSGLVDINEFEKLYAYINQWLNVFKTFDRDASGHIEEPELAQALAQMGFRFSPPFIQFLVSKSDTAAHKQVSVDQFIVLCVQIQRFTEAFRVRDQQQNGTITIGFEDFLGVALNCSL